jgi:hypothetical protein
MSEMDKSKDYYKKVVYFLDNFVQNFSYQSLKEIIHQLLLRSREDSDEAVDWVLNRYSKYLVEDKEDFADGLGLIFYENNFDTFKKFVDVGLKYGIDPKTFDMASFFEENPIEFYDAYSSRDFSIVEEQCVYLLEKGFILNHLDVLGMITNSDCEPSFTPENFKEILQQNIEDIKEDNSILSIYVKRVLCLGIDFTKSFVEFCNENNISLNEIEVKIRDINYIKDSEFKKYVKTLGFTVIEDDEDSKDKK